MRYLMGHLVFVWLTSGPPHSILIPCGWNEVNLQYSGSSNHLENGLMIQTKSSPRVSSKYWEREILFSKRMRKCSNCQWWTYYHMGIACSQIGPTQKQHMNDWVPGNPAGPEPKASPPKHPLLIILLKLVLVVFLPFETKIFLVKSFFYLYSSISLFVHWIKLNSSV